MTDQERLDRIDSLKLEVACLEAGLNKKDREDLQRELAKDWPIDEEPDDA